MSSGLWQSLAAVTFRDLLLAVRMDVRIPTFFMIISASRSIDAVLIP